ncbi:substrate-binding domain-containing protein [Flindersiella endophytica]
MPLQNASCPERRPTLGLLTANIHLGVGATLWSGIVRAARDHDINVVCLPGDEIGAGVDRNQTYDLVSPHRLDGLICWSSAIGLPSDSAGDSGTSGRLLRRMRELPVISLNRQLEDHQTLTLDSYRGMCEAISHLIEQHGRRRLAFIKGPTANPVTSERYRAYVDTLARHGIPFDPRLVSAPADFRRDAGIAATQVILDARGLRAGRDFDGLVACSDFFAVDALRLLRDRGIAVPEQVAVVSFNDSPEAWQVDPPLTSVAMPFDQLGERAVEILAARVTGSAVPGGSRITTPLVVRRSCGCPADAVQPARRPFDYDRWQYEHTARNLRAIGTALLTATSIELLTDALAQHLPSVGVTSCYLALYEGGPYEGKGPRPLVRLRFVHDGSRIRRPALPPYAAELLVPDGVLPANRSYQLVVEPLHVGPEQFGFALLEAGPKDGSIFRAIGDQVSAALKGIRLYQEVLAARDQAERADRVKSRLLTAVSGELRTPLEHILRRTSEAQAAQASVSSPVEPFSELLKDIHANTEHQLDVINDLLDLSHAEIEALDLETVLFDPAALLRELFGGRQPDVAERLPLVRADLARTRRALINVFGAADRLAPTGQLTVTAHAEPAGLAIRFSFTESAIPAEVADDIFEPFAISRLGTGQGRSLGLTIARRVIALHGGSITLEREPDRDTFVVCLPFPTPHDGFAPTTAQYGGIVLVGDSDVDLGGRAVQRPRGEEELRRCLEGGQPGAVVWDSSGADPLEWMLVRSLLDDPRLRHTPFLLYEPPSSVAIARGHDLASTLELLRPARTQGSVVIVDDTPKRQDELRSALEQRQPGRPIVLAADGATALFALSQEFPDVVVLTHPLPDMEAFDVLDRMRCDERLQDVPVLVLGASSFDATEIGRAEPFNHVVLAGAGILSTEETGALVDRLLRGADVPAQTGQLVRRAVGYLHRHYQRPLTRRQIAAAAGISEDYLSRMFHRQYGIGPWEYLNRLRIQRAKERLRNSDESIQTVARRVGFQDRAYFSRTFRKLAGVSPQSYRGHSPVGGR